MRGWVDPLAVAEEPVGRPFVSMAPNTEMQIGKHDHPLEYPCRVVENAVGTAVLQVADARLHRRVRPAHLGWTSTRAAEHTTPADTT